MFDFFSSRKCWVTCMKVVWAHFFLFWKQVKSSEYFWLSFTFSEKKMRRKAAKNNIKMTTTVKKSTHVYLFFSSSVFCLVINVSYLLCTKCMQEMVSSLSTKYCYWQHEKEKMKMKIIMSGCIRRTHEKSSRITKYTLHIRTMRYLVFMSFYSCISMIVMPRIKTDINKKKHWTVSQNETGLCECDASYNSFW